MSTRVAFNGGRCSHPAEEPVVTYGGAVLAYRCTSCTEILAHQGVCDGCGKDRRLTYHVGARCKRFCVEGCYRTSEKARKQATKETK